VRRCHASGKNKIDEASGQVSGLAGEVEAALDGLAAEIGT